MRRLVLLMLGVVIIGSSAVAAQGNIAGSPGGLSKYGTSLWQFEALLHETFGSGPVCASGRWRERFTSGPCRPLAVRSRYFYGFADARGSTFRVTSTKAGGFGNYPQPVLIGGRNVACDARETTFLVVQSNAAAFTLRCLKAGYLKPR